MPEEIDFENYDVEDYEDESVDKISGVKESIGLGTIDFVRKKEVKEWLGWIRKKPISMHDFEEFQNEIEGFISGLDADVRNNHFEALKSIKRIKSVSEKPEVQALKTNNIWGDISDAWVGVSARIDNISNFKTWIIEALVIYNQKLISLLNSIKQKIISVEELKAKKDLLEKNSDIVLQQYNKFMEMAKSLLDQKETTYQGLVNKLMEQIQAQNEVIKKLTLELNKLKEEQKEFVRKSEVQAKLPFEKWEGKRIKSEGQEKKEGEEEEEVEEEREVGESRIMPNNEDAFNTILQVLSDRSSEEFNDFKGVIINDLDAYNEFIKEPIPDLEGLSKEEAEQEMINFLTKLSAYEDYYFTKKFLAEILHTTPIKIGYLLKKNNLSDKINFA